MYIVGKTYTVYMYVAEKYKLLQPLLLPQSTSAYRMASWGLHL